jgi:thioredoxin-like negative regulator of GroEL
VILDFFETADQKDRDVLRAHLLELFKVVPKEEPALAKARVRLANLLF